MSTRTTYSPTMILVHWLSAACILALLPLGLWMTSLPLDDPARTIATKIHVIVGITTLILTLVRLGVLSFGPKVAALEMGAAHAWGVKVLHVVMYVALLGILASGVALFVLGELPAVFAGAAALPELQDLAPAMPHAGLSRAYIALLVAHIGGSLVHQWRHGGTLERMGIGPKPEDARA